MLMHSAAAVTIGAALFLPLDARALTLGVQDDRFSCTLNWAPADVMFTGQCGAAGQTLAVTGAPPYVNDRGVADQDSALAAAAVQDGITAYKLRIRLVLKDRVEASARLKRGQVMTDVYFWNVKDCRNAPPAPPVDSSCWIGASPWRAQGAMRAD